MYLRSVYEQMQEKQQRFMELHARVCTEVNRLQQVVRSMQIPWEGEANRQYLLRTEVEFLELHRALQKMQEAGEKLKGVILAYQSTERRIGDLIGGMWL